MPVYIGDYLADTMHLTTEQHGAYLLLLFHLWRRGSLPADEASLARIAGLGSDAWSSARSVLREFFEIDCEGWHHRRVERERERIARKQESNSQRARSAALGRWQRPGLISSACAPQNDAGENASGSEKNDGASNRSNTPASIRFGMQQAVLHEAKSESESESNSKFELKGAAEPDLDLSAVTGELGDSPSSSLMLPSSGARGNANSLPYPSALRSGQKLTGRKPAVQKLLPEPRQPDPRHFRFRGILAEYWAYKNPRTPEMPWLGRDAKALSELLQACPALNEEQFRQLLRNRARSVVAHGDRVYLWIANLTRYQEEIGIYNKPVVGGGNVSRAEINCNSVARAVGRALDIAQRQWASGADADGAGQVGIEQTALPDRRVPAADGPGPGGLALAGAGASNHRVEEREFADGTSRADGPLPHGASTADTGGAAGFGDAMRPNGLSTLAAMERGGSGA